MGLPLIVYLRQLFDCVRGGDVRLDVGKQLVCRLGGRDVAAAALHRLHPESVAARRPTVIVYLRH